MHDGQVPVLARTRRERKPAHDLAGSDHLARKEHLAPK